MADLENLKTWTRARLTTDFEVKVEGMRDLANEAPPLGPNEVDPDWNTLRELDMVKGPPARGWYPIVCFNEAQHTEGPGAAKGTDYKPSKGGGIFKCLHGHCAHLTVVDLRAWLLKQLIPDMQAFGQRLDGLVAAAKRRPQGDGVSFAPSPEATMRTFMLESYIHVEVQNKYWSVASKGLVERAAIDDRMTAPMKQTRLLHAFNDAGKRLKDIGVSVWLRSQTALRRVANITHRLGQPLIVDDCINIAPPIPDPIEDLGDPMPWLDLVDTVFVNQREAEHWLDWAAMVVTAWDEKPGWVPLLKGLPGAGKGMLLNPIKRYLDGDHWIMIQPQEMQGQFTYYAKYRLVIIEELKQIAHGTPHAVDIYTLMKKFTGRGNRMVSIRGLNKEPFTALDLSAWSIYSNEHAPLPLEKGERRIGVFMTAIPQPDDYYLAIGKWLDEGGWRVVIGWLQERWNSMSEAERETVRGNAPMTAAKQEIIDISGGTLLGSVIRMCVSGRHGNPWPDLMTMGDITNALSSNGLLSMADTHKGLGEMAVSRALRNEGAVQLFDSKPPGHRQVEYPRGRKLRLWCLRGEKAAAYEELGQGKPLVDAYEAMKTPDRVTIAGNVTSFRPK